MQDQTWAPIKTSTNVPLYMATWNIIAHCDFSMPPKKHICNCLVYGHYRMKNHHKGQHYGASDFVPRFSGMRALVVAQITHMPLSLSWAAHRLLTWAWTMLLMQGPCFINYPLTSGAMWNGREINSVIWRKSFSQLLLVLVCLDMEDTEIPFIISLILFIIIIQ